VGTLLDERVGLAERLANPRWSADGQQIYLEDRRGDSLNPYISRVSVSEPLLGAGEEPEIVIVGSMLSLFEIRQRGSEELIVFRERPGAGCDLVRIVASASCIGGSCSDQVNSTSPGVLVRRWATVQSITSDTIRILADGAKEGRKGSCTETGSIDLTVDSIVTGVQTTTLISGASGPSAK
jgi:hypothetical protein